MIPLGKLTPETPMGIMSRNEAEPACNRLGCGRLAAPASGLERFRPRRAWDDWGAWTARRGPAQRSKRRFPSSSSPRSASPDCKAALRLLALTSDVQNPQWSQFEGNPGASGAGPATAPRARDPQPIIHVIRSRISSLIRCRARPGPRPGASWGKRVTWDACSNDTLCGRIRATPGWSKGRQKEVITTWGGRPGHEFDLPTSTLLFPRVGHRRATTSTQPKRPCLGLPRRKPGHTGAFLPR